MTFSHGNPGHFTFGKAATVLGVGAVILTAMLPTTLHARGFKHHHTSHATHLGGGLHSRLSATFAGEANPNRYSIARVCRSAENRVGTRWGGSLLAVISMPGQYAPSWAKAARNPIYQQAATIALSQGCDAIDARGAASVGHADSFHAGCGSENCFYRSGAGHQHVRFVAYRHGRTRQRFAFRESPRPAAAPAAVAAPVPTLFNPFNLTLGD